LDYEELKSSLEQLEMLCTRVNEAVRSKENTEQLEWLQTHVQFTLDEVQHTHTHTHTHHEISLFSVLAFGVQLAN